jgi:emp24/gp25L/p24 family/GOLD
MRPCPRFSAWIDEDPPSPHKRVNPTVWKVGDDYDFSIDVHSLQRYRLCFLATSKEKHHLLQLGAASSARKAVEEQEEGNDTEQDAFFNGDYKITVGFTIRVHDIQRTLAKEEIGPDALRAIGLQKSAMHVTDQWENMHDHFNYMHYREAEHRRMSEQINDRVMGWTILESLLVVTMAIGQVMYWKSFFEQRRFL